MQTSKGYTGVELYFKLLALLLAIRHYPIFNHRLNRDTPCYRDSPLHYHHLNAANFRTKSRPFLRTIRIARFLRM